MAIEHGLPEVGSPSTEDSDPGTAHLYGVIWNLSADAVLQRSHAFNRVWYAPTATPDDDQLGWAVWDDTAGALVASVTLDPSSGSLVHGWNPVGDLGADVPLAAGPYVVFGRWVGKSPYDLSFGYPADGSGGPAPDGHISLTNGTFGFGALGDPRGGGGGNFDLRAWADAALSFGGTPVQASGAASFSVDLAGSGTVVREAAGALAVSASLAGAASVVREGAGVLPVSVSLAGAATRVREAAGALGFTVTAAGVPRVVRAGSGALVVTVGLTGTPSGRRVRPGAIVVGDASPAGIVVGSTGPGIVPG